MTAGELRFHLLNVPHDVDAVEACQQVGLDVVRRKPGKKTRESSSSDDSE